MRIWNGFYPGSTGFTGPAGPVGATGPEGPTITSAFGRIGSATGQTTSTANTWTKTTQFTSKESVNTTVTDNKITIIKSARYLLRAKLMPYKSRAADSDYQLVRIYKNGSGIGNNYGHAYGWGWSPVYSFSSLILAEDDYLEVYFHANQTDAGVLGGAHNCYLEIQEIL